MTRLAELTAWKAENQEHVRRTKRKHKLKKFGLTPETYYEMGEAQDWLCAICHQPETLHGRGGEVRPLAVDHDHETGESRALLCSTCNTGIGMLADSPERLRAAAIYIESYRTPPEVK